MKFFRLPKPIHIAKKVLPKLVADWMNTKSGQNFNIGLVQKLQVNMLIPWVIKRSKSWIRRCGTIGNFTHRACVIWALINHDLCWIIPDPDSHKRITLSLEFISTIIFQAVASYVKISLWGQHSSNRGIPYLASILRTVLGKRVRPNENPSALCRRAAKIVSNIINCVVWRPGCWSSEILVNWVLSDPQMTVPIVAPAETWSCVSHYQSPTFILL